MFLPKYLALIAAGWLLSGVFGIVFAILFGPFLLQGPVKTATNRLIDRWLESAAGPHQ